MIFKFNVELSDKDYLDYNIFWTLKSPYGKKQMMQYRIILTVFFVVISFVFLCGGRFSIDSFIGIVPYWIVFVLIQLGLNAFFKWVLKGQVKSLKKSGKMGYTPSSTVEFYDDHFIEISAENKIEQKYTAVERISVVGDKVVYIHVNNVMSYILPFDCFESEAQRNDFLEFIKSKCENVKIY